MKIYHGIDDFIRLKYAVVTSGTFDGVHVGHQKILARVRETARVNNGESVVITFWPHPRLVLYPDDHSLKLLNTFEEKAELLKEQGVAHLVRIPFTKEFSQLSSEDFIRRILVDKIGTRKLVIGYDHRFGKNREGSFSELKVNGPRYGFEVEEIPRQDVDDIAVSSTEIRKSLEHGDVNQASHLLGHPHMLGGRVVRGERLGRVMGFPTANIELDSQHKLIPEDGIYAVTATHEQKRFDGMLYIGYRPTLEGKIRSIEVNLFDFDREIYGEYLTIYFHQLIREDFKFDDIEALKKQLHDDRLKAIDLLQKAKK